MFNRLHLGKKEIKFEIQFSTRIRYFISFTFEFIFIQPLRIECGQKLKMIERETGLVAPDRTTTLYRMRYADNKNVIINFSNVTFV